MKSLFKLSLTALISVLTQLMYAQDTTLTFADAKEKAYDQKYQPAIEDLLILIESNPDNLDYQIFLARVYNWQKSYEKATALLDSIIQTSFSKEALDVMIQTHLWSKNYEEAIRYAELASSQYDESVYDIEKTRALIALNQHQKAGDLLLQILAKEPNNKEAQALQTIVLKNKKREIQASYLNSSSSGSGFHTRHYASLGFKAKVKIVPIVTRITYGNISNREGLQLETDAYPKINEKSYLYLNAGISLKETVFPEVRGGIEYFQVIHPSFSFSFGGKYMQFSMTDVVLYTGQITYYSGNGTKFSYRPYLADLDQSWSFSHALAVRFPETLKEGFFQLDLQFGTLPYEFLTSGTYTSLNTIRGGIQYQIRLSQQILLQPIFMYEYQEYLPEQYHHRFNSRVLFRYRF